MKTPFIKFLILLILSANISACSSSDDSTEPDQQNGDPVDTTIVQEIHSLVNAHRASLNLVTLEYNDFTATLSVEHSQYMIEQGQIGHDNFGDRFNRLRDEVNAITSGENVAAFQRSAQEVVTAWLNSSGHRANIEGDYTHTGIAAVKDANGRYYFTQIFYK